jgi:V/A-type H+/Na+-transporting ATPase subunit C
MTSQLKKYAYINAKLKTRMSALLTDDFFNKMIHSHSLSDALVFLKDTEYILLDEIYRKTGDIKTLEMELFKKEIEVITGLENHIDAYLLNFLSSFLLRYEIEVVKRTLRLWFDRSVRGRILGSGPGYLYRDKILHDLPLDAIIDSGSLGQIAALVRATPYGEILKRADERESVPGTLFLLEIDFDRLYYTRLLQSTEGLEKNDRETVARLLGIEIDMENIDRLIRIKTFYDIPADRAMGILIPGGHSIGIQDLQSAYTLSDSKEILSNLIQKSYPGWQSIISESGGDSYSRLILFDKIIGEILSKEFSRIRGGNPFSIGIMLVYLILKRNESEKVRAILNGKFYNISEEQMKSVL